MNDKVETKGKTVKDAVAEALLRLGARRDEVNVTILEEAKSGFLGLLGGRPAKVQVEKKRGGRPRGGNRPRSNSGGHSLSEGSEGQGRRKGGNSRGRGSGQSARGEGEGGRNRQESSRNQGQSGNRGRGQKNEPRNRRENQQQENTRRDGASSGNTSRDDSRQSNSRRDNRRTDGRGDQNRRPRAAARTEIPAEPQERSRPAAAKEERREPAGSRGTNERNQRGNRNRRPRSRDADLSPAPSQQATPLSVPAPTPSREQPKPRPAARETTNDQEATRMENKPAAQPTSATATVIKEGLKGVSFAEAIRDVPEGEVKATLEKLAGGMLIRAGFPCRCQVHEGDYLQVRVVTDDASAGMLIGRHGATVDSVEHLVERMISTARGDRVKMNLDINNYRRRRQDTLADRVDDAVNRVQETGREYHLEPMNARERRLVHLQVEAIEGLTTVTVAEDRSKHVVISREDAAGQAEPVVSPDQPEG